MVPFSVTFSDPYLQGYELHEYCTNVTDVRGMA